MLKREREEEKRWDKAEKSRQERRERERKYAALRKEKRELEKNDAMKVEELKKTLALKTNYIFKEAKEAIKQTALSTE